MTLALELPTLKKNPDLPISRLLMDYSNRGGLEPSLWSLGGLLHVSVPP